MSTKTGSDHGLRRTTGRDDQFIKCFRFGDVAAALQDYGRAVIVGSPSSHGKGTVQEISNLDYFHDLFYPQTAVYKPMGALKLTIEKFYRINGGSTQYKGVTSDVVLPDPYAYLEISEQTLEYAPPWDQVKPLNYQKWTEPLWEPQELKTRSTADCCEPNFAAVHILKQVKAERSKALFTTRQVPVKPNRLSLEAENYYYLEGR